MSGRRWMAMAALVAALVLLPAVPAAADHDPRSTADAFSGIGFDARGEGGPLLRAHPASHYKLDVNVGEAGVLDVERSLEKLFHLAAAAVWNLTALLTMGLISIFMWAFSFDLLESGLGGVGEASDLLYNEVVGQEGMVIAILCAGLWGIWKALVQRRYAETAGAIGMSVAFAVAALFFVYRPVETVTTASAWGNQLSNAFLSIATVGPEPAGGVGPRRPGRPETTKAELSDRLFRAFVYDPWVVLNFGGLRHCVNARDEPTGRAEARGPGERCIDHGTAYAPHWLRHPVFSDERKAEYEALNRGKAPDEPDAGDRVRDGAGRLLDGILPGEGGGLFSGRGDEARAAPGQFAGRTVSRADEPAVDMQQEGAGLDRLALALLVFVGNLGAVVLLGALSLGIVLAQVIALLLVAFAPIALIAAIFPGRGHDFFRMWARRLVEALMRKAIYSLIIAVILAVLSALFVATSALPWGVAFAFQSAFLWMVFLGRKEISGRLTGGAGGDRLREVRAVRPLMATPQRAATALGTGAVGAAAVGVGYGTRRAGEWNASRRERSAATREGSHGALFAGLEEREPGAGGPGAPGPRDPLADRPARTGRPAGAPEGDRSGGGAAPGGVRPGRSTPEPEREAVGAGATRGGATASAQGAADRSAAGGSTGASSEGSSNGGSSNGASNGRGAGRGWASSGPEAAPAGRRYEQSPKERAEHAEQRIADREAAPGPHQPTRGRAPWSALGGRSRR